MAIDRDKVIEQMSRVSVKANEKGLIPAFNVLVNLWPAAFWNTFSRRMIDSVDDDIKEAVEELLVNAAHECGYHTGHGIITSDIWNTVIGPMVEKPEDVLHGAFAVFSAFGWGKTEIVELIPGEKMVVRSYDYYESDVVKEFPEIKPRLFAHMIRGVCGAFMDLAYGGEYDSTTHPGLYTFRCKQVKGIEMGDSFGEFVVVKGEEYEQM